jgi:proteasome assembly chaperone (PAC2) family protein
VDPLAWEGDPPELRSPILVAAFAGWNDAAGAATAALEAVAMSVDAEPVAQIDPEEFFDFQVSRPTIRLTEGQTREIDWPQNALYAAKVPAADRDLVLASGIEPNLRWRGFAKTILDAAERLGVELVVTLGALLADVPHTRPVPITGLASDPKLVDRLGLSRSNYEGPTGIVGVIHDACRRAEVPSASLWAAVPHYASLAASPKAALALCTRLADLLGTEFELDDLERASAAYEAQVSDAVASDEETEAYVRQLEERRDALGDALDVPSGETLAAELTRFLREHEARREEEGNEEDS